MSFIKAQNSNLWEEWVEKYGKTFRYHSWFGCYHLGTMDMRAINYVLSNSTIFPKSERNRRALARVLGPGLLSAELHAHKRQRRIMNPSFGPAQIRGLAPTFCEKSNQLRDIWLDLISGNPEGVTIDVLQGLGRATLDIIGTTGFGYEFNSLQDGDEDELAQAFAKIFDSDEELTKFKILKSVICGALGIPTEESRRLENNIAVTKRIGKRIVDDKKMLLIQEEKEGAASSARDLLSLLIKSNMAQGTMSDQSMSDEEVLGQISTFLAAGHETTSTSTAWALYALTLHPTVQTKLRQELLTSGLGDSPSMADLEKLPYLDKVVHEVLRVHPAAPMVARQAVQDAVIPVGESYKDVHGISHNEIRVQKWDTVMVPIKAMNRSKDVWGDDALDFRPERWDDLPPLVKEMPGVWGHLMTFVHGNQSCIGFRFAVVEMKALLYSLLRSIEFAIDPEIEIEGKTGIVTRPCVKSQPKQGNQMPLICKPVTRA
ncbi:cytochrome P450 family protein [Ceratobasidium sp. AG-Ba]|nr:cytochrome P450 family protein [Ceratobasidium sp. AG-Ba]